MIDVFRPQPIRKLMYQYLGEVVSYQIGNFTVLKTGGDTGPWMAVCHKLLLVLSMLLVNPCITQRLNKSNVHCFKNTKKPCLSINCGKGGLIFFQPLNYFSISSFASSFISTSLHPITAPLIPFWPWSSNATLSIPPPYSQLY